MLSWTVLLFVAAAARASSPAADLERLDEAARWIYSVPAGGTEYRYTMTAKIRLLLFWIGRDDVGGGYIRRGNASDLESIELLFGSDPGRAPRRINRWGAATEIRRQGSSPASALFAFMKASKGDSVSEMEAELKSEKTGGRHLFEAIVSRVEPRRAISRVLRFHSNVDFESKQFGDARTMVMDQLSTPPTRIKHWDDPSIASCHEAVGFLFAVSSLLDAARDGKRAPQRACYVYNARPYRVTLASTETVDQSSVRFKLHGQQAPERKSYRNLLRAGFDVENLENHRHTTFEIVVGTEGALRGVPVQITHQPNWWFKVVLNLL